VGKEKKKANPGIKVLRKNGPRRLLQRSAHTSSNHRSAGDGSHGPNPAVARKTNPGILDWIVDFFVTPIKEAIATLLDPILSGIFGLDVAEEVWKAEEIQRRLPGWRPTPPKPIPGITPERALEEALDFFDKTDSYQRDVNIQILFGEFVTAGQVDVGLSQLHHLPHTLADFDVAKEIASAPYRQGFLPALQRYWLKQFTPNLPPYQDMIGVYVREGYLEEKWVELPAEFSELMKELGYSEDVTRRLWGKHWVLPDVQLLYEMFHKKIIDYDTMALMLKFHDYEPVWRDRLIQNAYEVIPRVDLRRAYMYGLVGYEGLQERFSWLGFKPGDDKLMADIAQRFALTAYHTRLLTVARAAYRKGVMSGEALQYFMEKVGLPQAAQDLVFIAETVARSAAVVELGEEPRTLTTSQILRAYSQGVLSLSAARERLTAEGFLEEDREILLALNTPETGPAPEPAPPRALTTAQILQAYQESIIDFTRAWDLLGQQRYPGPERRILLALYRPERVAPEPEILPPEPTQIPRPTTELTVTQILRAYQVRILDFMRAWTLLSEKRVPGADRRILLELYEPAPPEPAPDVPPAAKEEIMRVRKVLETRLREGYIYDVDFAWLLTTMGYSEDEIETLVMWAEQDLALEETLELAKEYDKLVTAKTISVEEYGNALRKLGMTEARITRRQKHVEALLAVRTTKKKAKEAS